MSDSKRRWLVAVVGDSKLGPEDPKRALALSLGKRLVDGGCRVVTGGLGGVMDAAMQGARASRRYREGDTVAILPGHDPREASPSADIVIATGMHLARNLIVANSDAVVAIGGGAGTLSEIALAWQLRRPVVALAAEGWSGLLAGTRIDHRARQTGMTNDLVHGAADADEAVRIVLELVPRHGERMRWV